MTINNPDDYELDHKAVKNILHLFNPDYFCLVDYGEKTKTSLNKDWFKMAGAEGLEPSARGFGAAHRWYYLVSPNAMKSKNHSNYQQSQDFAALSNI